MEVPQLFAGELCRYVLTKHPDAMTDHYEEYEDVEDVETCPRHNKRGELVDREQKGKKLYLKFRCPEGHTFTKVLDLK